MFLVLLMNREVSELPDMEDIDRAIPVDIGVVIGAAGPALGVVGESGIFWRLTGLVFVPVFAFRFLIASRASKMLSSFPVTPKIPPSVLTDSQVL